jgi:biopolymer transport protein ExbB
VRKLLAVLLSCMPMVSFAWWSDDWNFRKEITFDLSPTGADIAASPADVPVLIRLHLGNFGYFGDTQPDGSDLRFVAADDKTPLKSHIERYDATSQLAFVWVNVPKLSGGLTTDKIYLYYGASSKTAPPKASDTYDVGQVLVYHYGDGEAAPIDSTAYNNKAASFTAEMNSAALIAGGAKFSGAQLITVPASTSLRLLPDKGLTLSSWVRIDQAQGDAHIMALEDAGKHVVLGIRGAQAYARVTTATGDVEALQTDSVAMGTWHQLAAVVGDGKLTVYVDGKEVASTAAQAVEIAGTLSIGNNAAGSNGLVGEMDETQVAATARKPEWIKATALAQGQESILTQYGADAQKEGEETSYFATTMKNVTVDGWVVIIILAVMFVIAMLIIVGKTIYLLRLQKANTAFIKEFERMRGDPTALDRKEDQNGDDALGESPFMPHIGEQKDVFKYSSIYRLYHHGVQEMNGRVARPSVNANGVKTLTPQAMAAIHAAMDATQVRLTQKMQSNMVLLTIAIAGGPFLGLLGTVVGVMITFAAIAASGDVNVNAIAPGIAAALAATVAGLAVAIPALFGYNWLNTKIKEINADMRVFVDEFVTRVAEYYS